MIDYEKLKEMHELANKWSKDNGLMMIFSHRFGATHNDFKLQYQGIDDYFETLDNLITKLRELTQHEHKFKIGDTIWYLDEKNDPDYIKIDSISYFNYTVLYKSKDENFSISHRHDLYATRNELIKSQIEYWHKLLHSEID